MTESSRHCIREAENEADHRACFPVLRQLRPELTTEASYLEQLSRMRAAGFRLCLLEEGGQTRAVAGYRFLELFATGPILYVDDLVTDAAFRSRGHGEALLSWLMERAEERGCRYLELDSGVTRVDAHRFYERFGLEKVAVHFSKPCAGVRPWRGPS